MFWWKKQSSQVGRFALLLATGPSCNSPTDFRHPPFPQNRGFSFARYQQVFRRDAR
jgi:hypothetical protein